VRWSGQIKIPESTNYGFFLQSHGGVRLFIHDRLVVDNGETAVLSTTSSEVNLPAGNHNIKLEFFQNTGEANCLLFWKRPGNENGLLTWHLRNANSSGQPDLQFDFGAAGDIPIVGDWNGDKIWTVGAVSLTWDLRNSNSAGKADLHFKYGRGNKDKVIVGDWD